MCLPNRGAPRRNFRKIPNTDFPRFLGIPPTLFRDMIEMSSRQGVFCKVGVKAVHEQKQRG
jgi:hypothetical protein